MITKKSPLFFDEIVARYYDKDSINLKWRFLLHYPKMITFLATNLEKNRNGRKGLKNNIYNIYYD